MKSRLNITVDNSLMEQAKRYADSHRTSVSQLVEEYFRTLARTARKKNVRDLMKELPTPNTKVGIEGKEAYYESRKKKYGF